VDELAGALRNEPLELRVMAGIIPTLAWPAHPDGSAELLNWRWQHSTLQRHPRRPTSTPSKSGMIVRCRRAFHLLSTMYPGSSAR